MVRYYLAAAALRFFSSTALGRTVYRDFLGNQVGRRRRVRRGLDPSYVRQGKLLLDLCRKHGALHDGMSVLEIGTGWIHFYAIFLRLFYEIRITAVDAWDNRQLEPLKSSFAALEEVLETAFALSPREIARAHTACLAIQQAVSFDDLYARLGITYQIDPTLDSIPDRSHDFLCSFHVLEHIDDQFVARHVRNMSRVLRPAGFQIHQIGLDDHLAHYDRKVHNKNFMRYSKRTWQMLFANRVQFFSRILRSEWVRMFEHSGMVLREELVEQCDPTTVRVHHEFGELSDQDRACVIPTFVWQKHHASPGD